MFLCTDTYNKHRNYTYWCLYSKTIYKFLVDIVIFFMLNQKLRCPYFKDEKTKI